MLVGLVCILPAISIRALADEKEAHASSLPIPRIDKPLTISDLPEDSLSTRLAVVEGFVQHNPNDGEPVTQPTTAYLAYDRQNLYVGFICRDINPQLISSHVTPRDSIVGDDAVGVVIDTYKDHRRAYRFSVNPLGVQFDALVDELGRDNSNFDTVWYSQGRLMPWGYKALLTIPFKSLRFPPLPQQTWGIVLTRFIPRNSELSTWPTLSLHINGYLIQEGEISDLSDITPGKSMELMPYGFFSSSRLLDKETGQFKRETLAERIGVDIRWLAGTNLTLDATINPDFSQVESDTPQITVNRRFEVSFPEKRPFFMENSDFFETPITVLFTRRIADPQVGSRLTGKFGGTKFGLLLTDDRAPGEVVLPGDPSAGHRAVFNVFRISQDIHRESSVGFIWSDREFRGSFNRVLGPDGRWKISSATAFEFQFLQSFSRNLVGQARRGTPTHLAMSHTARHLNVKWNFDDRSPGLEIASGFVPRVDLRTTGGQVGYTFRPQNRWVTDWHPYISAGVLLDHRNVRQDYEIAAGFWMFLPNGTDSAASYAYHRERFAGMDFLWREFRLHADNRANRWFA